MITIYCGDNTVLSRDALTLEKHKILKSGKYIQTVDASNVIEIIKSGGSDAVDLFTGAPMYETTNLIASLRKSYARKAKEHLRKIADDATIELLDWEDKSTYDLGIDKDKFSFVHEYKMSENTFTLLPIKLCIGFILLFFALFEIIPSWSQLTFDKKYLPLKMEIGVDDKTIVLLSRNSG